MRRPRARTSRLLQRARLGHRLAAEHAAVHEALGLRGRKFESQSHEPIKKRAIVRMFFELSVFLVQAVMWVLALLVNVVFALLGVFKSEFKKEKQVHNQEIVDLEMHRVNGTQSRATYQHSITSPGTMEPETPGTATPLVRR